MPDAFHIFRKLPDSSPIVQAVVMLGNEKLNKLREAKNLGQRDMFRAVFGAVLIPAMNAWINSGFKSFK